MWNQSCFVFLIQISEHAVTLDRDTLIHVTQGTQRRNCVYVYRLDRKLPDEEEMSLRKKRTRNRRSSRRSIPWCRNKDLAKKLLNRYISVFNYCIPILIVDQDSFYAKFFGLWQWYQCCNQSSARSLKRNESYDGVRITIQI